LTDLVIADDFLRFSAAVNRLAQGMWGGFRRPVPVRRLKREYKEKYKIVVSVGYGPWKETAAQRLTTAAIKGRLPVYVSTSPEDQSSDCDHKPVMIPTDVLGRLITRRGGIPNRAIQPSMKTVRDDKRLLVLLHKGLLVVRKCEFESWYRSDRANGRWPSQRSRLKQGGRPSVQTHALRDAVINAMRSPNMTIAALHRQLVASGRSDVPSPDTLERLVDQLYLETGEAVFFRIKRSRRKPTSGRRLTAKPGETTK
jgi:hypothetical protein